MCLPGCGDGTQPPRLSAVLRIFSAIKSGGLPGSPCHHDNLAPLPHWAAPHAATVRYAAPQVSNDIQKWSTGGVVRQAARQGNGTTDAHRCTPMVQSPAWQFTATNETPTLASGAEAVAAAPSVCIGGSKFLFGREALLAAGGLVITTRKTPCTNSAAPRDKTPRTMRHIAKPRRHTRLLPARQRCGPRHSKQDFNANAEGMHAKYANGPEAGAARHGGHRTTEPGEPAPRQLLLIVSSACFACIGLHLRKDSSCVDARRTLLRPTPDPARKSEPHAPIRAAFSARQQPGRGNTPCTRSSRPVHAAHRLARSAHETMARLVRDWSGQLLQLTNTP